MAKVFFGYVGRFALSVGLAAALATAGVVVARMNLLLFGFTSWSAWLTLLIIGAGGGAGAGSLLAWLWLKGVGPRFSLSLALFSIAAGIVGGGFGFSYGAGLEPECCASPTMGPIAYSVLGALVGANLSAALYAIIGQRLALELSRAKNLKSAPRRQPN